MSRVEVNVQKVGTLVQVEVVMDGVSKSWMVDSDMYDLTVSGSIAKGQVKGGLIEYKETELKGKKDV